MASSVMEERVLKLKVDENDLTKGLQNASKGLGDVDKGMKSIDGSKIDAAGKSTQTFGDRLKSLVSHIPIFGKLTKSSDGFNESIGKAPGVLGGFSEQLIVVQNQVSAFTIAAGQMLANFATNAVSKFKEISFSPIMDGWSMYEDRIDVTNRMTAALGKGEFANIKATQRELQDYALTTRYSIADMTQSLGTMVNAGIDLDTASKAIRGWGNQAAGSGASTQGFANSLQFGVLQALSKGVMMTQDWSSVESAGMDTVKFKQMLIDIAKEKGLQGTPEDAMGFRESLSEKWLTSDVLLEGMSRALEDESLMKLAAEFHTFGEAAEAVAEGVTVAWSDMWETLFGEAGSDEITAFWTKYGEMVGDATKAFAVHANTVAKEFVRIGGRTAILNVIDTVFQSIGKIVNVVGQAFKNVFPTSTESIAKSLLSVVNSLNDAFKISDATLIIIGSTFEILFNIIKVGIGIISALSGALRPASMAIKEFIAIILQEIGAGMTTGLVDGLLALVVAMIGQVTNVIQYLGELLLKSSEHIKNWVEKARPIATIGEFFRDAALHIKEGVGQIDELLGGLLALIASIGNAIGKAFSYITNTVKGFFNLNSDGWNQAEAVFKKVGQTVVTVLSTMAIGLLGVVGYINTLFSMMSWNSLAKIGFTGIVKKIQGMFPKGDKKRFSGLIDSIKDVFGALEDALGSVQQTLKTEAVKKISQSVLMLVGALAILTFMDKEATLQGIIHLGLVMGMMSILFKSIAASQADVKKMSQVIPSIQLNLVSMAVAVGLLAIAVAIIGTIDTKAALNGVGGVIALIVTMGFMQKSLNKSLIMNENQVMGKMRGLLAMGASILLLAVSVRMLGSMDMDLYIQGMIGAGLLISAMFLVQKYINTTLDFGQTQKKMSGLIAMSASILILTASVYLLGSMEWSTALRGVVYTSSLIGALGSIQILLSTYGKKGTASVRNILMLMTMTSSIVKLSKAVVVLGELPWTSALQGLIGIKTIIIELGLLLVVLSILPRTGMDKMAMVIASVSLLVYMVTLLAAIPWEAGLKAVIGLSMVFGVIVAAMYALSTMTFVGLAGIGMLVAMVTSLAVLVPILLLLGITMPIAAVGILTLAAALTVLLTAGAVAGIPLVTNGLIFLSAAIALIGLSISSVFVSFALFAAGVASLTNSIIKLTLLFKLLGNETSEIGYQIGQFFGEMLPGIILGAVEGILNAIEIYLPKILETIIKLVVGLLEAIDSVLPSLEVAIRKLLITALNVVLKFIVHGTIQILEALLNALESIALWLINNAERIYSVVGKIMAAIIKIIGDGIIKVIEAFAGKTVADKFRKSLNSAIEQVGYASKQMSVATAKGIDEAVKHIGSKSESMRHEALRLARAAGDGSEQIKTYLSLNGIEGGSAFVKGLKDQTVDAKKAGKLLEQMVKDGMSKEEMKALGQEMGLMYVDGVWKYNPEARKASKKLSDNLLGLGMNSTVLGDAKKAGETQATAVIDGYIEGLKNASTDDEKAQYAKLIKDEVVKNLEAEPGDGSEQAKKLAEQYFQEFSEGKLDQAEYASKMKELVLQNTEPTSEDEAKMKANAWQLMNVYAAELIHNATLEEIPKRAEEYKQRIIDALRAEHGEAADPAIELIEQYYQQFVNGEIDSYKMVELMRQATVDMLKPTTEDLARLEKSMDSINEAYTKAFNENVDGNAITTARGYVDNVVNVLSEIDPEGKVTAGVRETMESLYAAYANGQISHEELLKQGKEAIKKHLAIGKGDLTEEELNAYEAMGIIPKASEKGYNDAAEKIELSDKAEEKVKEKFSADKIDKLKLQATELGSEPLKKLAESWDSKTGEMNLSSEHLEKLMKQFSDSDKDVIKNLGIDLGKAGVEAAEESHNKAVEEANFEEKSVAKEVEKSVKEEDIEKTKKKGKKAGKAAGEGAKEGVEEAKKELDPAQEALLAKLQITEDDIAKIKETSGNAGVAIAKGVAEGIANSTEEVANASEGLFKAIGVNQDDNSQAVNAGKNYGTGIMTGLSQGIQENSETAKTSLDLVLTDITTSVSADAGSSLNQTFVDAGKNLLLSMRDGFSNAVPEVKDNLSTSISEAVTSVVDGQSGTLVESTTKAGGDIIRGLGVGFTNAAPELQQTLSESLTQTILGVVEGQSGHLNQTFTSAGRTMITGLSNGINSSKQSVIESINGVVTGMSQPISQASSKYKTYGSTSMTNLVAGINTKKTAITTAAKSIATAAVNSIRTNLTNKTNALGSQAGQNLANGINSKRGAVNSAASNLTSGIKGAVSGVNLYNSGQAIAKTLQSGIASWAQNIRNTVSNIMQSVRDMTPNSPAKKGPLSKPGWTKIEKFGEAVMGTMQAGLVKHGRGMVGSLEGILSEVSETVDTIMEFDYDSEFNPVITPVLNMENLEGFNLASTFGLDLMTPSLQIDGSHMSLSGLTFNQLQNQQQTNSRLDVLNERIDGLAKLTRQQTNVIRDDRVSISVLDTDRSAHLMADRMAHYQDVSSRRMNRLEGIIDDL